jgi:hypothetical protein
MKRSEKKKSCVNIQTMTGINSFPERVNPYSGE